MVASKTKSNNLVANNFLAYKTQSNHIFAHKMVRLKIVNNFYRYFSRGFESLSQVQMF
jgi:hypothetical protein